MPSHSRTAQSTPAPAATTGDELRPWSQRLSSAAYHRVGLPLLGIVGAVACWWFLVAAFDIEALLLPPPQDVVVSLVDYRQTLLDELWVTLMEVLAGFAAGAAAGLLVATLLVASRTLERATMPLVVGLNAIPKVALAPLLMLWLGLGHGPKIALAASICFFPIMIATMAGLRATPAEFGDLARSLSASRWQTFVKVKVPWALPQVFVGLKLGMTLAVIGAVVAQIHRPSGGLGTTLLLATQSVNTSLAFAVIFVLMVLSICLFYGVVALERLLLPWARETTAAQI